jgi:hypothetical protein
VDALQSLTTTSGKDTRKVTRFRVAILVSLTVFLVWEVATRSVAEYFADAWPEMAVRLRSTNPTALLNLAAAKSDEAQRTMAPPPQQDSHPTSKLEGSRASLPQSGSPPLTVTDRQANAQIRSWAELALLNDPLNAHAFGILGRVALGASDDKQTETLMHAAMRRSLLESRAVYWIMQKSYQDKDYRSTIHYADILFRTRPETMATSVMPILGKVAENSDASSELKRFLADNPAWRWDFLTRLPDNISDARTPLDILLSLKNTPTPPTAEDLRSYLNFLIDHSFYDLAYYTWLQFLPAERLSNVGHLFNGNFELIPSASPFDWTITPGSNVAMKIAARPDRNGEHALFVELGPGRVDSPGIKQLVMLPPGSYQFQGQYKGEIDSQRGLLWRITCAGKAAAQIGESPVMGSQPTWNDFAFSFSVPENDCPAQTVELVFDARWASEQFISGSIWYDDLKIVKASDVDP